MDEQTPKDAPEEREETIEDLDVPEGDAQDVKGGIMKMDPPTKK